MGFGVLDPRLRSWTLQGPLDALPYLSTVDCQCLWLARQGDDDRKMALFAAPLFSLRAVRLAATKLRMRGQTLSVIIVPPGPKDCATHLVYGPWRADSVCRWE